MTIIGVEGSMVFIRMPVWEYRKVAEALADMDDDNPNGE